MSWTDIVIATGLGVLLGWLGHIVYRRLTSGAARDAPNRPASVGVPNGAAVAVVPANDPAGPFPTPGRRPDNGPDSLSRGAAASRRVILHLSSLGRLGPDEVAPIGFTQGGMMTRLAVSQGSLANVLSRLVAARVLEAGRRHVAGQPRRLLVYRLTDKGESLARDLRAHPEIRRSADR